MDQLLASPVRSLEGPSLAEAIADTVMRVPAAWRRVIPKQDRRDNESRAALLSRVLGEFREMPGLRLTVTQAARFFGLRYDTCMRVLSHCVAEGRLYRTPEGVYKLDQPGL